MNNTVLSVLLGLASTQVAWAFDGPADGDKPQFPPESQAIEVRKCQIKAVNSARLATDRPGVLATIDPKEGDIVHEGQLLARLMDEVAQASLEVAKLVADDRLEIEYANELNAVDTTEYEKDPSGQSAAFQYHSRTSTSCGPDWTWKRVKLQIDKAVHEVKVNLLKAKQAAGGIEDLSDLAPFDGVVTSVLEDIAAKRSAREIRSSKW